MMSAKEWHIVKRNAIKAQLFLIIMIVPFLTNAYAQNMKSLLNQVLPPSPQAAAFARYGEYPVGYSTGVPNISIPLYEIELEDYKLPISISYHASGIKQDDVASVVGLGWVLNAGGVISRTIKGAPDLKYGYPTVYDTLYYSPDRIKELIDKAYTNSEKIELVEKMATNPFKCDYDIEADRFSFNFKDKAGIFRYSCQDKKFIPLNHYPIYINATSDVNDESYFYIVDSDGTIYHFNALEYSGNKNDEGNAEITSWYLTEINTPSGDITFKYVNAEPYEMYAYSSYIQTGTFITSTSSGHYAFNTYTSQLAVRHNSNRIGLIFKPLLLSEINWKGNQISFSYSNNRNDIFKHRLTKMEVRNIQGDITKTVTFDNDLYLGQRAKNNERMLLNSLSISNEGEYFFGYNQEHQFPEYRIDSTTTENLCAIDYWGYNNGTSSKFFIPTEMVPNEEDYGDFIYSRDYVLTNSADRNPNEEYTQTGILKTITFPTGGYTSFSYELNRVDSLSPAGGLRVKRINTYEGGRHTDKKYEYSGYRTYDHPKHFMVYDTHHFYVDGTVEGIRYPYKTCVSNPILPLTDNSGNPMFYEKVKEIFSDGSSIIHMHKNGVKHDIRGTADECHPSLTLSARYDEGHYIPLLVERRHYDKQSNLIRTELYDYEIKELKEINLGTKLICITTRGWVNGGYEPLKREDMADCYTQFRPVVGHIKSCLLKSKTITDNITGYSTTENYTYDDALRTLLPQTISNTGSDGKNYLTDYEYTFERNDTVCKRMANDYCIVDPIITTKRYCNGVLISTTQTLYKYHNLNDWFYPEFQYASIANNSLEKKVHYLDYDEHGNLLALTTNRRDTTALVWGYEGNYPVARINGCDYAMLKNHPTASSILTAIRNCTNNNTMKSCLQELRTCLGDQYPMTAYLHKPLLGIAAITDQRGYTLYYDYDSNGKLSKIRDKRGLLQHFVYKYKHPFKP